MAKWYISILRINMSSLEFKLRKIDETRNTLLDEIKHRMKNRKRHKNI